MAIIVLGLSSLLGLMFAIMQFTFMGTSLLQAAATYFIASFGMAGTIALIAWTVRFTPSKTARSRVSYEQQLEDWQDWQFEEDAEYESLAKRVDIDRPNQNRKSA